MAKKCKPVTPVTIEEDQGLKKRTMKLAPIFLPQKRECNAPDNRTQNQNKRRKTRAKCKTKRTPSPIQKPEVLLSSDDDTIIDPFDLDTDTESVTSPALELVIGATREEESENNVWSEKRRPRNTTEVVGHTHALEQLKTYLKNFSSCRSVQDQYNIDPDELRNLQMGPDETTEAECVIISGKSGIGKTTAVYAAAGDLGMKVFELNASSRRSGKILMESLQEATQSHHLRGQSAAVPASTSIATFFHKKTPVPTPSQISSNSVILLDDVDLIDDEEEQDEGFWRSLKTFIRESKVPVVLTTTNLVRNILDEKLTEIQLVVLTLTNPPLDNLSKYLLDICSDELDQAIDVDDVSNEIRMRNLIVRSDFDVRKCLNHLQFEGILFFDKAIEPDPVVPSMDLHQLQQVQEINSLTNYWTGMNRRLEDIHSGILLEQIVSGCEDRQPFATASDLYFKPIDLLLKDKNWSETRRQLCSRLSDLFSTQGMCQDNEMILDLLPYISSMCASESTKAAVDEPELQRTRRQSRKRFLHYFESIGLYLDEGDRRLCSKLYECLSDLVAPDYKSIDASDRWNKETSSLSSSVLCLGDDSHASDSDSSDI